MYSIRTALFVLSLIFISSCTAKQSNSQDEVNLRSKASKHLVALAGEKGIGVRKAGQASEVEAANYIQSAFESYGLDVERQSFEFIHRNTGEKLNSQNIIARKAGKSDKQIIIGGHYDSTAEQLASLGAVDNAASIAVILALAESLASMEKQEVGITFIAFGAEEVGLQGAYKFIELASESELANYIGMVNLDGIVGSDYLYVHSAHSKPYPCKGDAANYASSPMLRDAIFEKAKEKLGENVFQIHPGFEGYPKGETGGWSDHAPFACAGIPIANFESTNFEINGNTGRDGYSQSVHPSLWTCFDPTTIGACDRDKEMLWGKIWHTGNDRLDVLNSLFPGRIEKQLDYNLQVLSAFLSEIDKYQRFQRKSVEN